MIPVLADTGALVALLDRSERFHPWAVEQVRGLKPPLLTCEAVLAELCFLLAPVPGGRRAVQDNLDRGAWRLDFTLEAERARVFSLMETYSDQPMSLADACLVRMAELHPDARVFTLDSHFRVYRRNRRQVLPLVIPADVR
jgi:predicted nucleic acid-binding protein